MAHLPAQAYESSISPAAVKTVRTRPAQELSRCCRVNLPMRCPQLEGWCGTLWDA